MRRLLAFSALLLSACFTRTIAERMGASGWFAIGPDATFTPVSLTDPLVPCRAMQSLQHDETGPLLVLVPGVNGDGPEWSSDVTPLLLASHPSGVFMLRWVPYDSRDAVAQRLALGISRLAQCLPHASGRLIVLAHSAGGLVSSYGASLMHAPEGAPFGWVTVLTVASPLAGTVRRAANADGSEEATLMLDLGTAISAYPDAAPGVRVLHLRTQYPADSVMNPVMGHAPNDPVVGVPGAPQIDLPADLNHMKSLHYVAGRVADGTWTQWLVKP